MTREHNDSSPKQFETKTTILKTGTGEEAKSSLPSPLQTLLPTLKHQAFGLERSSLDRHFKKLIKEPFTYK